MIGPYFFVDENERHVTVNGERYRAMLEDYLWQILSLYHFYHVKFIIKCIYFTHLHFSIFNSVFKFSAQNASESS